MRERRAIAEKLRRKEAEIKSLEEKAKTARVYVQALRDVLNMLGGDGNETGTQANETVLRAGSAVARARDVIIARGRPVHVNDLLEAQGKEITRESRASLTSSLSAYVRRGEIFTRPAPNTFGLIELGHVVDEERPVSEPPAEFGRTEPSLARPIESSADDMDEEIPF